MTSKIYEVDLYTPHKKQEDIHNYCLPESKNFWTICIAGRQSGKTRAAENQAMYWCLTDASSLTWFVSPTEAQAIERYKSILQVAFNSGLIANHKGSKGGIEITWTNGSKIQFKSAASENSLRGASVNYMILDEAAWIKKSTVDEILLPTLTVTGKKGLIISTPKGKNWLWEWYINGLDKKQKRLKSLKFTSQDNPFADKEEIEAYKLGVPIEVFNQEYMAEFVDSATVFRNLDEISTLNLQLEPVEGDFYYAGIDIGMINDDTVITILNHSGDMVYLDSFTGIETPEMATRILNALHKWKPKHTLMETNGQGLPIYQIVQRNYPNVYGYTTTNENKGEIVNQLIAAFSAKELKILNDDELKRQLEGFIFDLSPTGKIRYKAASGFKDDMVMSLAIAWESFVKNKMGNRYSIMSAASVKPVVRFGQPNQSGTQRSGNYVVMGGNKPKPSNSDGDNSFYF